MTITFSMTGRDIVTRAMRDRGVLALDEDPEAHELDYGIQTLNLYLKSLGAKGVTPWTDEVGSFSTVVAQAEYALTPRPLAVNEARIAMSATYQRPLSSIGAGEYRAYPNKAQAGDPVVFTSKVTPIGTSIVLWPVPSSVRTIHYSYSRVIEDVSENAVLDMPQMWTEAVQKILAVKMTAFGDTPVLPQLAAEAAMLERQLLDYDRPDYYVFEPADC